MPPGGGSARASAHLTLAIFFKCERVAVAVAMTVVATLAVAAAAVAAALQLQLRLRLRLRLNAMAMAPWPWLWLFFVFQIEGQKPLQFWLAAYAETSAPAAHSLVPQYASVQM